VCGIDGRGVGMCEKSVHMCVREGCAYVCERERCAYV